MAANYVKFYRGTPQAFQNLTPKNPDTLYFINDVNSTEGYLIYVVTNLTTPRLYS